MSAAAGMGKTALLHAFWDSLVRSDVYLLTASCVPSDRNVPFAMLAELLQSPDLAAKDSSRAMKLLDDCALLLEDPSRPGVRAAWAERGFAQLISQLSERRTVVICVDDVHHADPGSIAQLLRLVRRIHSAGVFMVLTERTRLAKVYSPLHTELLGHPHVRSIRLGPLSQRGVREMISVSTHTDNGAAPAADIHASTGGSPLLVQAMLQDLGQPGQGTGENTPEATAFGQTVLGCLHSTDPTTLDVARAAALLDVAADPTLLSLLLDLPLETVTWALAELRAMGLVHGCQLRHCAARQVILGDMAPDDRRSAHVRAARLLFETATRPSTVAGHLLCANTATEPWMVKTLIDAAETELDNDARHARACLGLARRFSASDPRRQAEITAALTRAEMRLSPAAALRLLPQVRTAISEGMVSGRLALELSQHLFWFGGAADNERLYRDLERLADTEDPRTAMELGAWRLMLTTVFPQLADRISDALEEVNGVTLASAAFTTNTRVRVFADLSALLQGGAGTAAVRNAERVLTVTRLTDDTAGLLSAAVLILIGADETGLAEKWADRLLHEASVRGADNWQGLMAARRAEVALAQGDLPGVERHAGVALDRMPPQMWGVPIGGIYATMLRAFTEMGRHSEAGDLLSRPVPDMLFDSVHGLQYLHAKGHHYLATHEYQTAFSAFRACGELMARWGLAGCTVLPWRTGAAEALLRLGAPNAARRLAQEQLAGLGPRPSPRLRGAALRVLAATRGLKHRVRLLGEAVDACQRGGDSVELARALIELSKTQHRLGDTAKARMTARRAWHTAAACQAWPLARRAYAIPGGPCDNAFRPEPRGGGSQAAAGEVPSRDDTAGEAQDRLLSLSGAERRVCDLAGQGLTNREIAGRLFITMSTVEQHLTSIYRKLRVKGRESLPATQGAGPSGAVPSSSAASLV